MDENAIRGYGARLRSELTTLEVEVELGAEDRATVALDQQSVDSPQPMNALQRQAAAAAPSRRLDSRRGRIGAALAASARAGSDTASDAARRSPRRA